jgi:hypothetical protein
VVGWCAKAKARSGWSRVTIRVNRVLAAAPVLVEKQRTSTLSRTRRAPAGLQ